MLEKKSPAERTKGVKMNRAWNTLRKGLLTAGVLLFLTGCGEEKINPVSLQPESLLTSEEGAESAQTQDGQEQNVTDAVVGRADGEMISVPGGNALVRLQSGDKTISGSGFIAQLTEDAVYICTNRHVIEDADAWNVTFADGSSAAGEKVGCSQMFDLGVVTVKKEAVSAETLAKLETVKVDLGEWVSVRDSGTGGIPIKVYRTGEAGLTGECVEGTIVNMMAYFEYGNGLNHTQMDITLENGDSGSAVFDENGNLFSMVIGATYEANEKPERWGLPLTSLITGYKEITGLEWISLF